MKLHVLQQTVLAGISMLALTQCMPQRSIYRGEAEIGGYRIVEIEGCEYIYKRFGGHEGAIFTHKGNCKNPIHVYK